MTSTLQRVEIPPREAYRQAPFTLTRASDDDTDDGLTLDGFAAVFNRETLIDSWEGRFREKVALGSMRKSFRESPPVVQFDHGTHPLVGSIPIASNERGYPREEDDPERAPEGGAHVIARLHDNWLVEPVRQAIASHSISGMSFRFVVLRDEWHTPDGRKITDPDELARELRRSWLEDVPEDELLLRTLRELRVPELGPVVFPAYRDTTVGVRSGVIDLARLDEPDMRSLLAQAVLMADRAEAETRAPEAPEGTAQRAAADHPSEPDDTPHATAAPAAGEHLSTHLLSPERRARLADVRRVWADIHDKQKGITR